MCSEIDNVYRLIETVQRPPPSTLMGYDIL